MANITKRDGLNRAEKRALILAYDIGIKGPNPDSLIASTSLSRESTLESLRSKGLLIRSARCGCTYHLTAEAIEIARPENRFAFGHQTQHGMTRSSEYAAYNDMKRRCNKQACKDYPHYGGRGIRVCNRWMERPGGFLNFLADMGQKPSRAHTLDRERNDEDYGPDNCRWVIQKLQTRNRRVTLRDESGEALGDVAERTGISYATLFARFKKGDRGERLVR